MSCGRTETPTPSSEGHVAACWRDDWQCEVFFNGDLRKDCVEACPAVPGEDWTGFIITVSDGPTGRPVYHRIEGEVRIERTYEAPRCG